MGITEDVIPLKLTVHCGKGGASGDTVTLSSDTRSHAPLTGGPVWESRTWYCYQPAVITNPIRK
jgi:hypothetical protein